MEATLYHIKDKTRDVDPVEESLVQNDYISYENITIFVPNLVMILEHFAQQTVAHPPLRLFRRSFNFLYRSS